MTDDEVYTSITFPATFEGTAAIGADFSATLKLKTSNGPKVLEDLKAMPRGTYDITIVARQAELKGDSTDREWASMTLEETPGELAYDVHCVGGHCPVFAVHTSGEFEGKYVCEDGAETFTLMEIVDGVTLCPRHPDNATVAEEAAGETQTAEDGDATSIPAPTTPTAETAPEAAVVEVEILPLVVVVYPGGAEQETEIGDRTLYGEFVADFITYAEVQGLEHDKPADYVVMDDEGNERKLKSRVAKKDHGARLFIESVVV